MSLTEQRALHIMHDKSPRELTEMMERTTSNTIFHNRLQTILSVLFYLPALVFFIYICMKK